MTVELSPVLFHFLLGDRNMKYPMLKATAFAALATVLVVAPSAAQEKAATPAPVAGSYTLAKVDNADLPILIAEKDGCKQEVTAAELTITAENKYTFESTIKETCGDKVQEKKNAEKGSLAVAGAAISFTPEPPAGPVTQKAAAPADPTFTKLYTGAVEGSDLKVTLKTEKVLVFKKKG
jgi:hypothetical protein